MSGPAVSDFILSAFADSVQGLMLRSVLVIEVAAADKADSGPRPAKNTESKNFTQEALSPALEYARKLGANIDFVPRTVYDAAIMLCAKAPRPGSRGIAGSAELGDAAFIERAAEASLALKRGASFLCVFDMGQAARGISNTETAATEKIFTFARKVSICASKRAER